MRLWKSSTVFQLAAILGAALLPGSIAAAQAVPGHGCDDSQSSDRPQHCEVREEKIPPVGNLSVDASPNGGIKVTAWNQGEIHLIARVRTTGDSVEAAEALARQIQVRTDGGNIRSEGPSVHGDSSWSVSFELMVPAETSLNLRSVNGGISVTDVAGAIDFRTTNGGVRLHGVRGEAKGGTTNGGIHVELAADATNRGVDAETKNGGIRVVVPEGFSGHLEAETNNGGISLGFPVTVEGRIGRKISTDIGQGGPLVRLRTVNGGISLSRR